MSPLSFSSQDPRYLVPPPPPPRRKTPHSEDENDSFTEAGAKRLIDKIVAHWAARGVAVVVEPRRGPFAIAMRSAYFVVRSNLINGGPAVREDVQA